MATLDYLSNKKETVWACVRACVWAYSKLCWRTSEHKTKHCTLHYYVHWSNRVSIASDEAVMGSNRPSTCCRIMLKDIAVSGTCNFNAQWVAPTILEGVCAWNFWMNSGDAPWKVWNPESRYRWHILTKSCGSWYVFSSSNREIRQVGLGSYRCFAAS